MNQRNQPTRLSRVFRSKNRLLDRHYRIFFGLPGYGVAALTVMVAVNLLTYNGTRLLTTHWPHLNMSLPIDYAIPFVKEFIVVYLVLAYAQWFYGFYLSAREDRDVCLTVIASETVAKLVCMVCFLVVPATLTRPEIHGTDIFSLTVAAIYRSDAPDNLFPSIHCLESYLLLRTMPMLRRAPAWYRRLTLPTTLLVMASTLLVKQHVVLDVIGAVGAVELGLAAVRGMRHALAPSPTPARRAPLPTRTVPAKWHELRARLRVLTASPVRETDR